VRPSSPAGSRAAHAGVHETTGHHAQREIPHAGPAGASADALQHVHRHAAGTSTCRPDGSRGARADPGVRGTSAAGAGGARATAHLGPDRFSSRTAAGPSAGTARIFERRGVPPGAARGVLCRRSACRRAPSQAERPARSGFRAKARRMRTRPTAVRVRERPSRRLRGRTPGVPPPGRPPAGQAALRDGRIGPGRGPGVSPWSHVPDRLSRAVQDAASGP